MLGNQSLQGGHEEGGETKNPRALAARSHREAKGKIGPKQLRLTPQPPSSASSRRRPRLHHYLYLRRASRHRPVFLPVPATTSVCLPATPGCRAGEHTHVAGRDAADHTALLRLLLDERGRMEFPLHLFLWHFHHPESKDCVACPQLDIKPITKGSSREFLLFKIFLSTAEISLF